MKVNQLIVNFCAEEVERQGRGPIQVAWMVEAWMCAADRWFKARRYSTLDRLIIELGNKVEHENPDDNWRQLNVRVGSRICPNVAEVPDLMDRWIENLVKMAPAEAYFEFEMIHPFADGNGRVGKIVFNSLCDSMSTPQMPPNFFNCANP